MNGIRADFPEIMERSDPLQIGFIPVADCAPVVLARESGLFDKYELRVELRRESRWQSIRDKVLRGELSAAHAPATLPFVTNLCLESDQGACVAGMVLSLQGNSVTISRQLWNEGVRDPLSLRDFIYENWKKRTYCFGVAFPYSPQYFLLRQWLKAGGIIPHVEVRIVVLPPEQMFPTLRLGYLDGYCVGEPWASLAVAAEAGACVATSADLAPLHPEKVLMVRRDFAERRASEHERLIAALLEACAFCDQPRNRALLSEMLAQAHYVNAPSDCLGGQPAGTSKPVGPAVAEIRSLSLFHKHNANDPTEDKAAWVVGQLYEIMEQSVLKIPPASRTTIPRNVFRRDIFERARLAVFDQTQALSKEVASYEAGG